MNCQERYNKLSEYLKNKFGEKTLKICVDGGFSCPNRDGTLSNKGCIFCSNKGSGEHLNSNLDIILQIKNYFSSYKANRANKFILYFQNFTNTYDKIENLKKKYDSALINDKIIGLQIATRPDCINEDIVKLIHSYSSKLYVCVELGLQTANENTGKLLNLCYSNKDFSKAVALLNKYNIDIVTHIMIGLPTEKHEDLINTVNFINKHNIQGIKIHSTYIIKNTELEKMYNNNSYTPITLEYYISETIYVLTHISPKIVIHRLSGDAPKTSLVAPNWNSHKKWIINGINKQLIQQNLWQGKFYNN